MSIVAGTVMVGAGALCLAGSIRARQIVPVISAAVMLVAMIDHAFVGTLPSIAWAAALIVAGLALGLQIRQETGAASAGVGVSRRAVASSALAYIVMAWLMLSGGPEHHTAVSSGAAHGGHGAAAFFGLAPLLVGAVAGLVLLSVSALALRDRKWMTGVEGLGMAAMIVAMMVPHS